MNEMQKTTGKNYQSEKTVECDDCGEIFDSSSNDSCPVCGSVEYKFFQRTKAFLSEEVIE